MMPKTSFSLIKYSI